MKIQFVLPCLILTSVFTRPFTIAAQINSWTNPASGNWQDGTSWSLGVPSASQSHIMFTNSGWKAVAINRATALNYPASLNVRRLTVSSPVDSFNTLMLNFSGREWPLRVAESFRLHPNSVFLTMDSGLSVENVFMVDGTVIHTDFSEVSAALLYLGNIDDVHGAQYNLTNGILNVPSRLFVGVYSYGILRQHGGSNRVHELRVGYGEYHLYAGDVAADVLRMGSRSSHFNQYGGSVTVTNPIIVGENDGFFTSPYDLEGRYALSGGTLHSPAIRVGTPNDGSGRRGAEGFFIQSGGSNLTTTLDVGAGGTGNTFHVDYTLDGGFLRSSATTVGPGFGATFSHSEGLHFVDGPLTIQNVRDPSSPFANQAQYALWAGATVKSRSLVLSNGWFAQIDAGSTNEVVGDLLLIGSGDPATGYILYDGRLTTSNTIARVVGSPFHEHFRQDNGVHLVTRLLDLSASNPDTIVYGLRGGQLIAPEIRVRNGIFTHYFGGVVSNSGTITMAGGHWSESVTGTTRLGALRLDAAPTNSVISFLGTGTILRFLPTAAVAWAPDGTLTIRAWRGSPNGGGDHQVVFGHNGNGLSVQQLSQIRFRDPAGFPSGDYPARILSTGEIVPVAAQPTVMRTRNGGQLVLQWPPGYTLQAATNISGPFTDISSISPSEIQTGPDRERYFRLHRIP